MQDNSFDTSSTAETSGTVETSTIANNSEIPITAEGSITDDDNQPEIEIVEPVPADLLNNKKSKKVVCGCTDNRKV